MGGIIWFFPAIITAVLIPFVFLLKVLNSAVDVNAASDDDAAISNDKASESEDDDLN